MKEANWLTAELKQELKTILSKEYGKIFKTDALEQFANDYVQMIDLLDKANLKFKQRPPRLVDLERNQ